MEYKFPGHFHIRKYIFSSTLLITVLTMFVLGLRLENGRVGDDTSTVCEYANSLIAFTDLVRVL